MNQLTSYYRTDDKFRQLVDDIHTVIQRDLTDPAHELERQTNVLLAEGEWLDHIGERLGFPRPYALASEVMFFGFDNNGVGFDQGPFINADDQGRVRIADDAYRTYIIAHGGQLITDCTVPDMNSILEAAFGTGHYIDNMDMTMDVRLSIGLSQDIVTILEQTGLITKPGGVRLRVLYDQSPVTGSFGFDDNGTGFDQAPFITVFSLGG